MPVTVCPIENNCMWAKTAFACQAVLHAVSNQITTDFTLHIETGLWRLWHTSLAAITASGLQPRQSIKSDLKVHTVCAGYSSSSPPPSPPPSEPALPSMCLKSFCTHYGMSQMAKALLQNVAILLGRHAVPAHPLVVSFPCSVKSVVHHLYLGKVVAAM